VIEARVGPREAERSILHVQVGAFQGNVILVANFIVNDFKIPVYCNSKEYPSEVPVPVRYRIH
jgi:hypothetical protein